ncbi:MAG TPA: hypothetical protein VHZ55_07535 [Bryobacteraceae bacterium]|nr:hypothetical protein [Bryobacteraceae bacterium]
MLVSTALPAVAQLPLTTEQEHIFSGVLEGSQANGGLKCKVEEVKPFLDFGFRFEAGFVATCPISEFGGRKTAIGTVLRIKAENKRPVMLGQSFSVPAMRPEMQARTDLKHVHNDVEFSGVFAAGEGNYQVELAIFDEHRRVHQKLWKIRAETRGKERQASLSMQASSVSAIAFPPWAGTTDDGKGLHLAILLDAAPMNPYSRRLRAWDHSSFSRGSGGSQLGLILSVFQKRVRVWNTIRVRV